MTLLFIYMDDILLIQKWFSSVTICMWYWLGKYFKLRTWVKEQYFGYKINRDRSNRLIGLSQTTYVDKVIRRFNMVDSKRGFLLKSHDITLSKNQCLMTSDKFENMSKILYASVIGSVMYVMICSNLDVHSALSMVNRYWSNPGEGYWIAVKNFIKYIERTKDISWYTEGRVTGVSGFVHANVASPLTKLLLQPKFGKHKAVNGLRCMSEWS